MILYITDRNIRVYNADNQISYNSDYIAEFHFDDEWNGKVKTARFVQNGEYVDVVLADDRCQIPPLKTGFIRVGVFTDSMTSTYADVYYKTSIKDGSGNPVEPPEGVYEQLITLIESGILKGDDGLTPYVGSNNNWWIGDIDTGVLARGTDGEDGYTPVKGVDYFTEEEIQQIQNEVSGGAIGDFKAVVDEETATFNANAENTLTGYNANAQEKFNTYNANADSKFETYNTNAETKFSGYNTNAEAKLSEYNKNDLDKTTLYNTNADSKFTKYNTNAETKFSEYTNNADTKLAEYNQNDSDKTDLYNANAESKLDTYNSNAQAKFDLYNQNDSEKTEAYNKDAQEKLDAYNANAESKLNAYNVNDSEKTASYNANANSKFTAYSENADDRLSEYNQNADNRFEEFNLQAEQIQSQIDSKFEAYNTNAKIKFSEYNNNAESKVATYNQNDVAKTEVYNKNAQDKLNSYNSNAQAKLNAYNENAEQTLESYNSNHTEKLTEYNTNAETKTAEFDANAAALQTEVDRLRGECDTLAAENRKQENRIDALMKLNKGQTYDILPEEGETASRTAPSGAKYVSVDKVGGKSVVWNQSVPNFVANNSYVFSRCTGAFSGGIATLTVNADGATAGRITVSNENTTKVPTPIALHKYFLTCCIKPSIVVNYASATYGNGNLVSKYGLTVNAWNLVEGVSTYDAPSGHYIQVDLYGTLSIGDTAQIKNFMVIDLTQMFGSTIADYVYSLEQSQAGAGVSWFKKLFPADYYPYSEPTIISSQTDRVDVASADGTITQQIETGFHVLNSAGSAYDYIDLNEGKLYTWTYIDGNEIKALSEPVMTDIEIPTELTEWLPVEPGGTVTFRNSDDTKQLPVPNAVSWVRKLDEVN